VELKSAIQSQLKRIGNLSSLAGKTAAQARFSVFGVALQIVNVRVNNQGALEFTLTGVLPGGTIRLERSSDLNKWDPVTANSGVTSIPMTLRDDQPATDKRGYYRIVVGTP
jgi:hypothetical protein